MATKYPQGGFHVNAWLSWVTLPGAAIICLMLTWMDTKVYRSDRMVSANKVYHNLLYFWYAYLAVVSYIGIWEADVSIARRLLISVPGLLWITCLVIDNLTSKRKLELKWKYAHANNLPLWKNGWRIRRWTSRGYM